jgi:hypothetical protein
MSTHTCPNCGEYAFPFGRDAYTADGQPICPTCDLTPGENSYIDRILADSDEVYRQEHRAFQVRRAAEKGRRAS